MVATNTASDLELCASTYRHFSPAGFSSEIFIVENNSRVIQKTNNKRIEKIKREDILRENFQIYGIAMQVQLFHSYSYAGTAISQLAMQVQLCTINLPDQEILECEHVSKWSFLRPWLEFWHEKSSSPHFPRSLSLWLFQ